MIYTSTRIQKDCLWSSLGDEAIILWLKDAGTSDTVCACTNESLVANFCFEKRVMGKQVIMSY